MCLICFLVKPAFMAMAVDSKLSDLVLPKLQHILRGHIQQDVHASDSFLSVIPPKVCPDPIMNAGGDKTVDRISSQREPNRHVQLLTLTPLCT